MLCSPSPPSDAPDPLHVEPAWLTETVLALARGIAADLAFDRLPILADALEDAGCDNFPLLNHLRSDEPHRVDCWALRRLLRTTLLLPGNVPITFAYCPPGSFLMGSGHPDARANERPVHRVRLTKGFHAGIYPVTREQWRAVMGKAQQHDRELGNRFPANRVSWVDAQEWCSRASHHTGVGLRLPTESEWEYACRAGTRSEFYFGNEYREGAMHGDRKIPLGGRMNPELHGIERVGKYPPNAWGLHDCHGNVMEWCFDLYVVNFYTASESIDPVCRQSHGHERVVRGGSYARSPAGCRSAWRFGLPLAETRYDTGFRVVFTAT